MGKPQPDRVGSVAAEFGSVDLGDERLDRRLGRVAGLVSNTPTNSFPKAAGDSAELEGIYRFLSNESVKSAAILDAHAREVAKRASGLSEVLVLHDGSEFSFGGEAEREGLGYLPQFGRGFIGHFSLCVELTKLRPLGVIQLEPIFRVERKGKRTRAQKEKELLAKPWDERESASWLRGAKGAEAALASAKCRVIHVMDQEADDYTLFARLIGASSRFVIRGTSSRLVEEGLSVQGVLSGSRGTFFREVPIAGRSKNRDKRSKKAHPPRVARTAELHVRTAQVELPRPQRAETESKCLLMNVVQVFEAHPPPNEPAVQWTLFTTEPIKTDADVTKVIDIYCARWLIEEFFKALKTGCAFEQRQLESAHALLNALAVFSVVAWRMLALRTLSRTSPDTPAEALFSKDNIEMLRFIGTRKRAAALPRGRVTVRDMLLAIAGLGGHLKNNGEPGWITLGRGYDDFLVAELGWLAAVRATA